jgi:hypothetical protein
MSSSRVLSRRSILGSIVVACAALAAILVGLAPPASAADQGTGFGTWAPVSRTGWHGSVLAAGVHTYCIHPGLPAPTGPSTDHGVRGDARGLSAQQLVSINYLVSTYGQTTDPVQAASVGWAVKAIADRATTLHAWGYPGDSLAEAIHWTMSTVAPEHSAAIQQRAEQYHAEALAIPVPGRDAALSLTTDEADPRRGTLTLTGGAGTTARLELTHAVFADTGEAHLDGAAPGSTHAIVAAAPDDDARPFRVSARATLTAAFAPAVRYITTPDQQDTAGPGGGVEYTVDVEDDSPRPVVFSPGITTQVAAPEADGGPFVDDVTLAPVDGVWPQRADGSFVPVVASATVYRTEAEPVGPEVPADATAVGELSLESDPAEGGATYRVTSDWELPGPGYYTAVWEITAAAQHPEVAAHLERDYRWSEEFATPSQIVRVPPPAPPAPEQPEQPEAAPSSPPALAATGVWDDLGPRVGAGGAAALLLGGAMLAHLAQRRRSARFGARLGSG